MTDISPAGGNVTTKNSFRDSSTDTASELPLQSDADSPDLTTGEKLSSGTTTAERLKSAQSPLDNLLSETSEMFNNATDTVADMATDAYEGLQTLNQEYALTQRGLGALKILGGLGESFVGSVGIFAPEPATTAGGAILFAHGADVAWSGIREVWYGKPVETVTDQAVTEGAKLLGANEVTAKSLGDSTDIALGLGSAGVGAYQAFTRPLITRLEPIVIRPQTKPVSTNGTRSNAAVQQDAALTAKTGSKTEQHVAAAENSATMRAGTNGPNNLYKAQLSTQEANAGLLASLKKANPNLSNRELADLAKAKLQIPEVPHGFTKESFGDAQKLISDFMKRNDLGDLNGFATGSRVTGVVTNPKKTEFGQVVTDFANRDLDITLITSKKMSNSQLANLGKEFKDAFDVKLGVRNVTDSRQLQYIPIFEKIDF